MGTGTDLTMGTDPTANTRRDRPKPRPLPPSSGPDRVIELFGVTHELERTDRVHLVDTGVNCGRITREWTASNLRIQQGQGQAVLSVDFLHFCSFWSSASTAAVITG